MHKSRFLFTAALWLAAALFHPARAVVPANTLDFGPARSPAMNQPITMWPGSGLMFNSQWVLDEDSIYGTFTADGAFATTSALTNTFYGTRSDPATVKALSPYDRFTVNSVQVINLGSNTLLTISAYRGTTLAASRDIELTTSYKVAFQTITLSPSYFANISEIRFATDGDGAIAIDNLDVTPNLPALGMAPAAGALTAGTVGTAYSQTFAASGGTSYTYAITAGTLPAGLDLNTGTGVVSGTPASGGTSSFTVTATDVTTATVSQAYTLAVAALPPQLTGFTPQVGRIGGGTQVTLTGSHFIGAQAVHFGLLPAQYFSVDSDTQITATAPDNGGDVAVSVTTPGGTATSTGRYTYALPPAITQVQPPSGPTAVGAEVQVTGEGLLLATALTIDGVPVPFQALGDHLLSATTLAHAMGTVPIIVTTPLGTASASYTFVPPPPQLAGFTPQLGRIGGGTQVTLTGSRFTGAQTVRFGLLPAQHFTVDSDTQITAIAPDNGGDVALSVTTPGGTATSTGRYTYALPPAIVQLQPSSGPMAGGTAVQITGEGLLFASALAIDGTPTPFQPAGDRLLSTTTPAHAAGTVSITVTTPLGTASASYTYLPAPAIATITPDQGPETGGAEVTIQGSGLAGTSVVTFDGIAGTGLQVTGDTSLRVKPPAHAPGSVPVEVVTGGGSAAGLSYTYVAAPAVTALQPDAGPANASTRIVLTGRHFTGATAVLFGAGSTPAASFTVDSDTQITAFTPALPAGEATVQVVTAGGSAPAGGSYLFAPPPAIASITPAQGPAGGGSVVTLAGSGFVRVAAVRFGGVDAASFTVDGPAQITATTPTHAAGSADVTVGTPGGTAMLAQGFEFTRVNGACGAAAGQARATQPTAGLCSAGAASAVQSASGQYTWECTGAHGGASPQCSAPWASTGQGAGSVQAGGAGGWQVQSAAFGAGLPAPLPPGARTDFIPLALTLAGGTQSADVTVRYTQPVPPGAVYLKYGPSPDGLGCTGATACAQPHWYALPGATFAPDGLSVTFTLTDNGLGDSDSVPGQITDPGLPVLLAAAPAGARAIPALGPWALALLSLLLTLWILLLKRELSAAEWRAFNALLMAGTGRWKR